MSQTEHEDLQQQQQHTDLQQQQCCTSDNDSGCALDEYTWVPPGLAPVQVTGVCFMAGAAGPVGRLSGVGQCLTY